MANLDDVAGDLGQCIRVSLPVVGPGLPTWRPTVRYGGQVINIGKVTSHRPLSIDSLFGGTMDLLLRPKMFSMHFW